MAFLLILAAVSPAVAQQIEPPERRVALVIGNGAYRNAPALANPANDAREMGKLLAGMGFEVLRGFDLGRDAMEDLVSRFEERARIADVALAYYAGHGIQVDGGNYLLPVDAKLEQRGDLRRMVKADWLVEDAAQAKRLALVILDACRDNPLATALQANDRSLGVSRGLAPPASIPSQALIAYATSAGAVASDGEGGHSPFTAALLEHLPKPGIEVGLALRRVYDAVVKATGGRQRPATYNQLGAEEFYFVSAPSAAPPATRSPTTTGFTDRVERARAATDEAQLAEERRLAEMRRREAEAELRRAEEARATEERRRATAERERELGRRAQAALAWLGRSYEPPTGVLSLNAELALKSYMRERGLTGEPLSEPVIAALEHEAAARDVEARKLLVQDSAPPRIEVPQEVAYDQALSGAAVRGKVEDDGTSGIARVLVDGAPAQLGPDGRFEALVTAVRIDEARPVTVIARDRAGNEARQVVTVTRRTPVELSGVPLPALDPTKVRARPNPNAVALVIGVERYQNLSKAKYAAADARVFVDYALYALGVPRGNIVYLLDDQARAVEIEDQVDRDLRSVVRPGESEVYVFFSGHGFAQKDRQPRFLAYDFRETAVLRTSIGLAELVEEVRRFQPRSVTLFADACFSGRSREGEMLVAGGRLLMVEVDLPSRDSGAAVLSACPGSGLAVGLDEVQHGAFSYVLMRGLQGDADANGDKTITSGELNAWAAQQLPQLATTPVGPQWPYYNGLDPDRVVVRLQ